MPDTQTIDPIVARYVCAALERQHAARAARYHPDGPSPARAKTLQVFQTNVSAAATDATSAWGRECRRLGFGTLSMNRHTDFRPFIPFLANVPATAPAVGDPIPR
jgi:hypothetical protein